MKKLIIPLLFLTCLVETSLVSKTFVIEYQVPGIVDRSFRAEINIPDAANLALELQELIQGFKKLLGEPDQPLNNVEFQKSRALARAALPVLRDALHEEIDKNIEANVIATKKWIPEEKQRTKTKKVY